MPAVGPAATSPSETSPHIATPAGTAIPAEASSVAAEASRAQMAAAITEFTAQDGTRWERSFGSASEPGDKPVHETVSPAIGKTAGQSPAAPVHLDSPLRPPQSAVGQREAFPATEGLLTQNRAASPKNSEFPAIEVSVEENPAASLERGTTQKTPALAQQTTAFFRTSPPDEPIPLHNRLEGSNLPSRPIARSTEGPPAMPPVEQEVMQTIAKAPKMPANFPAVHDSFFSREVAGGADQRLVNLRTEDFAAHGRIKLDAQTHDAPADSSDNPDLPAHDFSNRAFSRHDLPNRGQEQVEEFVVPGTGALVRGKELASMVSAEPAHVTANISGEQNPAHIVPRTGHRIGQEVSSQAPA
ncbi:MAG: hypothetical protein IH935_11585, partial [Acidobacteria bacterium]|nr:hypothetical protein [Acidobacteriota bacterium]